MSRLVWRCKQCTGAPSAEADVSGGRALRDGLGGRHEEARYGRQGPPDQGRVRQGCDANGGVVSPRDMRVAQMQIYCHSGITFQKFGPYGSNANESVGHRRREMHVAARRGRLRHAVVFGRLSFGQNTGGRSYNCRPASVTARRRAARLNRRAPSFRSMRLIAFGTVAFESRSSVAAPTKECI